MARCSIALAHIDVRLVRPKAYGLALPVHAEATSISYPWIRALHPAAALFWRFLHADPAAWRILCSGHLRHHRTGEGELHEPDAPVATGVEHPQLDHPSADSAFWLPAPDLGADLSPAGLDPLPTQSPHRWREFQVSDWPEIFSVTTTPLKDPLRITYEDSRFSKVEMSF